MTPTTPLPDHIRATISNSTLDRVTRFFDCRLSTILTELLQNARRSGATKVDVTVIPRPDNKGSIRVCDNGSGIADPAILLSYGNSDWIDEGITGEDPAGMGILSLASRGCTVSTVSPAGAWSVDLEPDHFTGKTDAHVLRRRTDGENTGTTVKFPHQSQMLDCSLIAIQTLEQVACHYPLPVTLTHYPAKRSHAPKGSRSETFSIQQKPFLPQSAHAVVFRNGIRYAVVNENVPIHPHVPNLNFHGLTLNIDLPVMKDCQGKSWGVYAEIVDCRGVQFTLPARDRIVRNEAFERIRHDAAAIILETMARTPDTYPDYTTWKLAADMRIRMDIPPPRLYPWTPKRADIYFHGHVRENVLQNLPPDAIRVASTNPYLDQHLAHALKVNRTSLPLFESDGGLRGYPWYDKLPTISPDKPRFRMTARNTPTEPLGEIPLEQRPVGEFPHEIQLTIPVFRAGLTESRIVLPTNLALLCDEDHLEHSCIHQCAILVTRDQQPSFGEITEFLEACLFFPSDDPEAGTYETQLTDFRSEAHDFTAGAILEPDQATETILREAILNHVSFHVPHDTSALITLSRDPHSRNYDVSVKLEKILPKTA